MKDWSLRTRLSLLLGTVLSVFIGLSTVTYLTSSREEDRLEAAFAEEAGTLADLPAQRALLRRIDVDEGSFLLTDRPEWLARRTEAIAAFRDGHRRIGLRLPVRRQ